MRAVAVLAIDGYQRFMSPYKGFRCAHDVLHGQGGCSGYARRAILKHGVVEGLSLLRQRFAACKAAALTLQAIAPAPGSGQRTTPQGTLDATEDERKRRQPNHWSNVCDCSPPGNCGPSSSGSPAAGCDGMPSLGCSAPADAIDVCSVGDACACSF